MANKKYTREQIKKAGKILKESGDPDVQDLAGLLERNAKGFADLLGKWYRILD